MKIEQKDVTTGKIKIINVPDPTPVDSAIIKSQRQQDIKVRINAMFADYLLTGISDGKLKMADLPAGIKTLIAEYNAQ